LVAHRLCMSLHVVLSIENKSYIIHMPLASPNHYRDELNTGAKTFNIILSF
jgi:hypothetical protein